MNFRYNLTIYESENFPCSYLHHIFEFKLQKILDKLRKFYLNGKSFRPTFLAVLKQ